MCGIFAFLNHGKFGLDIENIRRQFIKGKDRGPEESRTINNDTFDTFIGFHRLAINGFNDKNASQPFNIDNIILVCNGEIYNHKELYNSMDDVIPKSNSDCEVIIHLYKKYGIKQTLQMLDGVFAFIIFDLRDKNLKIHVARDTYGVRPLFFTNIRYIGTNELKERSWRGYDLSYKYHEPEETEQKHIWLETFGFASEMKQLIDINIPYLCSEFKIKQYQPGTYSTFGWNDKLKLWLMEKSPTKFSSPNTFINYNITSFENACLLVNHSLKNAVQKRVCNSEREICCLLSGGLDSSLIASLVARYYKQIYKRQIHTWSIGFKGSEDLFYADKVAEHIGSIHHRVEVSETDFLKAIDYVIYTIESYDTTTVRASVGNWLISEYIRKESNAKVVFNGDGSDEVAGGYLYFWLAPDDISFDKECRKLLSNIHYFDVLRSDRSISSNGLEARTPFLDRSFVQTYLSIPIDFRNHTNYPCEKYLIRKAFEHDDLLPKDVLFRTKEAFSDGVSKNTRSWHTIIKEHCSKLFTVSKEINEENYVKQISKQMKYTYNPPKTYEQLHYRMVFEKYYKNQSKVIPYFWMPNFVEATDASARSLDIYKKKYKNETNQSNEINKCL